MAGDGFHAFVRELLGGLGPVTIKKFFGGGGVYADGVMFALLAGDVIYLKADDALKRDLGAQGSGPFIWTPSSGPKAGQSVEMSYWRLPDGALDESLIAGVNLVLPPLLHIALGQLGWPLQRLDQRPATRGLHEVKRKQVEGGAGDCRPRLQVFSRSH